MRCARHVHRRWYVDLFGGAVSMLTVYQAAYADDGISRDFHVGSEVAILGVTVFLLGLGKLPVISRIFRVAHTLNDRTRTSLCRTSVRSLWSQPSIPCVSDTLLRFLVRRSICARHW